jgi:hypothetical protein
VSCRIFVAKKSLLLKLWRRLFINRNGQLGCLCVWSLELSRLLWLLPQKLGERTGFAVLLGRRVLRNVCSCDPLRSCSLINHRNWRAKRTRRMKGKSLKMLSLLDSLLRFAAARQQQNDTVVCGCEDLGASGDLEE